ncbi:MAG TPA: DNA-3-methyladenine glycosylase [Anaerolineales bacterium]|nr:DNA-3-methyladenine glycosylase [Anaerolineales bacterium]
MPHLPRAFFARPTLIVARELLGQSLVKVDRRRRLAGIITEVEAYIGEEDLACHARAGRTRRTEVMYWQPGRLYVYFTYGMHWMMNIVTERKGFPAAVLVRGIFPTEGIEGMRQRRGRSTHLTDGPAKIAQAFGIDKQCNGIDLCARDSTLWIERGTPAPNSSVVTGPRVGLGSTPEPWLSKPWNFSMKLSDEPA